MPWTQVGPESTECSSKAGSLFALNVACATGKIGMLLKKTGSGLQTAKLLAL